MQHGENILNVMSGFCYGNAITFKLVVIIYEITAKNP